MLHCTTFRTLFFLKKQGRRKIPLSFPPFYHLSSNLLLAHQPTDDQKPSEETNSPSILTMTSTAAKEIEYVQKISASYDSSLQITGDNVTFDGSKGITPARLTGKVRDRYDLGSKLALVTTDRQSGFDRMLAKVPFKGQVLNLTSAYWFDLTKDIVPNHLLEVPHPNVSIVKKCTPFPIEFVVR